MVTNKDLNNNFETEFSKDVFYIRAIRNLLKKIRVNMVLEHIGKQKVHIDLGCGDCSLLKLSPCAEKYGLDQRLGDYIKDKLDFPDRSADYITMLAFIEHLDDAVPVIKECERVLKVEGRLIITTPLKRSEKFLKLWHKDIEKEHKMYFDRGSMEKILSPYFRIERYKKVFLNQLFVCVKK